MSFKRFLFSIYHTTSSLQLPNDLQSLILLHFSCFFNHLALVPSTWTDPIGTTSFNSNYRHFPSKMIKKKWPFFQHKYGCNSPRNANFGKFQKITSFNYFNLALVWMSWGCDTFYFPSYSSKICKFLTQKFENVP